MQEELTFYWKLKKWAKSLKAETYAIYLAARDPRTPWYAKALAFVIAAYAVSPIDLIPDFIPVLGYLDDLIIVPIGIALVIKLIPSVVLSECRMKADTVIMNRTVSWSVAAVIVGIWIAAALLFILWAVT